MATPKAMGCDFAPTRTGMGCLQGHGSDSRLNKGSSLFLTGTTPHSSNMGAQNKQMLRIQDIDNILLPMQ